MPAGPQAVWARRRSASATLGLPLCEVDSVPDSDDVSDTLLCGVLWRSARAKSAAAVSSMVDIGGVGAAVRARAAAFLRKAERGAVQSPGGVCAAASSCVLV